MSACTAGAASAFTAGACTSFRLSAHHLAIKGQDFARSNHFHPENQRESNQQYFSKFPFYFCNRFSLTSSRQVLQLAFSWHTSWVVISSAFSLLVLVFFQFVFYLSFINFFEIYGNLSSVCDFGSKFAFTYKVLFGVLGFANGYIWC